MEDQASVVADLVDLETIGEISRDLSDRGRDTGNGNDTVANVRRPASAETDSGAERSFAEESQVIRRVVVHVFSSVVDRRRRQDRSGFGFRAGIGVGSDMIVVDPESGAAVQVHAFECAPSRKRTELESNQIVGHVVDVVKVIRAAVAEHRVGLAGCVFEFIPETEPSNSAEHAQSEAAALSSVPRGTRSGRTCCGSAGVPARIAACVATSTKEAAMTAGAATCIRLSSTAAQREREEIELDVMKFGIAANAVSRGHVVPIVDALPLHRDTVGGPWYRGVAWASKRKRKIRSQVSAWRRSNNHRLLIVVNSPVGSYESESTASKIATDGALNTTRRPHASIACRKQGVRGHVAIAG